MVGAKTCLGRSAVDLGVGEVELLKLGEVSKEIQTATHLSVGEAEDLKLSEVPKERQAAAHLGVVEAERLELSDVLKEGQAATHLGGVEFERLELSEVLKEGQVPLTPSPIHVSLVNTVLAALTTLAHFSAQEIRAPMSTARGSHRAPLSCSRPRSQV